MKKRFHVEVSPETQRDVTKLNDFIAKKCSAPLTAKRYHAGLIREMKKLEKDALLAVVEPELSEQYGEEIRRVRYKEMTILYSVRGDEVYIQRIRPQSMIIFYVDNQNKN